MSAYNGGSLEADHLCVLVHGLWGNPEHMASVAKALRKQYPPEQVYILVAERNSGSFTYDGIELGGERVCSEIEEELEAIKQRGGNIKKISMVGYSLGGLVARYAIGLLHARGVLDNLECMTFTAFASPFLGVRSPLKGWANQVFNVLGARTLCMSGRQLFGVDKFRDTGKPLLAVLADPKSIFMTGLARFQRRTLYCNITNDRTAVYYTTGIDKTDPFTDPSKIHVNYIKSYDPVILDPSQPIISSTPLPQNPEPLPTKAHKLLKRIPLLMALTVFVPIGIVAFLVNSVIQTIRSSKRVKDHNSGLAGINVANYRSTLWINELREAIEDTYENLNSTQQQQYLNSPSDSDLENDDEDDASDASDIEILALERKMSAKQQPTLALAPYQFAAIRNLDELGWRKYPVWIHEVRHSHAAIIVRTERESFREGWRVLEHWVKEEFLV